jgi:hypothetical protein
MLEKVIHRISEFYLKNVEKPQDDSFSKNLRYTA